MKKGFWNYTEPIFYSVVIVRLFPVKDPPNHWQNAFAHQERQAVRISTPDEKEIFFIDNGDGSGLKKIEARGGPGSMSRHIQAGCFEIVEAFPPESSWQQYDPAKRRETDQVVEDWQKEHHPEQYAKMQRMKEAWAKSDMNPRGENFKFKK